MQFRTQFDDPVRVIANPGSSLHTLYHARVDSEGVLDLVEDGEEDIYEQIQSHAESTDIHVLLKRYAAGEVDVLSRRQGSYGDFTEMPKTMAEMLNTVIAGEQTFESLPVEIRAKFDHSFHKWLASSGSDEWMDKMGYSRPEAPASDAQVSDAADPAPADPALSGGE